MMGYAIFGFLIGTIFGYCFCGLLTAVNYDDYGSDIESSENEEDRQTPSK
jgi:hypothetical protein